MKINPKVIDIFHLNANNARGGDGADFNAAYAWGIRGVIHKATQAKADRLYAVRRPKAIAAGMLWGAYHFNTGEDAVVQAKRFLSVAEPDANTLCALDLEMYPEPHMPMSLQMAREFMQYVDEATGRPCTLYSGNVIKQLIRTADANTREFFAQHKLWLAQYSQVPVLLDSDHHPLPWSNYFLWQYTGDGNGQRPHSVPGIGTGVDINHYEGSDEQLKVDWVSPFDPLHPVDVFDTRWVQTQLNKLGAGLVVDGVLGPKTGAAIAEFQKSHPPLAVDGIAGPLTTEVLKAIP